MQEIDWRANLKNVHCRERWTMLIHIPTLRGFLDTTHGNYRCCREAGDIDRWWPLGTQLDCPWHWGWRSTRGPVRLLAEDITMTHRWTWKFPIGRSAPLSRGWDAAPGESPHESLRLDASRRVEIRSTGHNPSSLCPSAVCLCTAIGHIDSVDGCSLWPCRMRPSPSGPQ
ncbi:hypothetical protein BO94DRAFT_375991 [Aspergillus sclerotioniger CBS 115572]|uniref:Uncharacterized protein n=1 Tax=Aspergillus sclerotioniger CBS 115572 TaxID=1450535 RepID=A0A317X0H0_9EURO|nr:hypothetical protein BO94DRAFT_375991 [Aspergillus sclerotioniger CBS 115572]PWY91661.1 hypothetical protein BO94DRAFT_375991 [Aspergillus sclerotioniger CBS 115572]